MGVSANTQSWSMNVDSEDSSDDSSDGQCSSPLQSSDEDFGVDEAEMHTVYSSYEKEGKSKGKTSTKKINERVLEEDIQSRAENEDEIQSSDEYDEDYLHFLKCLYSSNSNQGENAEIFGNSVNAGKRKSGRPQRNRSPGFLKCKFGSNSNQGENAEVFGSSVNAGKSKRGRPQKNRSPGFRRCHFGGNSNQGENAEIFGSSVNGGKSKSGRPKEFLRCHFGSNSNQDDNAEIFGSSVNGGKSKSGRPQKNRSPGFLRGHFGSNNNQGENAEVFGSSVTGGKRKSGRQQKNRSPGFEYETEDRAMSENYDCSKKGSVIQSSDSLPYDLNSKRGATKKRSRPHKNTSEAIGSEKDPIGEIAKSEIGGNNRKRGRLSQFEDIENGDEQFLEWLRDLELSGRCEKGGNSKRGRPQEGMNVGVGSEPKKDDHQQRGRLPKDWNKLGFDSERGCRRSRRIATKHI